MAVYQNDSDDNINFTHHPAGRRPPCPAPCDRCRPSDVHRRPTSAAIGIRAAHRRSLLAGPHPRVPAAAHGLDLPEPGPDAPARRGALARPQLQRTPDGFANYSFQDEPEILDAEPDQIRYPIEEMALPAKNRFNAGLNLNDQRFLGSVVGELLRRGVLDGRARPASTTASPTRTRMVNASFGVKWAEGKVSRPSRAPTC